MKGDDIGPLARDVPDLAIPIRDIAVRSAVKAVAPHLVTAIELIRNCVKISPFWKSLMKSSVKNRNLGKAWTKDVPCGLNTLYICRVVQRCQLDAIFDAAKHLLGYENRVSEPLTAVNDSMSNRVDIGDAMNFVNRVF